MIGNEEYSESCSPREGMSLLDLGVFDLLSELLKTKVLLSNY